MTVICLLMEEKSIRFKPIMEASTFQPNFLGSISNAFGADDSREVSLKGNTNDFSVHYNAVDKSEI